MHLKLNKHKVSKMLKKVTRLLAVWRIKIETEPQNFLLVSSSGVYMSFTITIQKNVNVTSILLRNVPFQLCYAKFRNGKCLNANIASTEVRQRTCLSLKEGSVPSSHVTLNVQTLKIHCWRPGSCMCSPKDKESFDSVLIYPLNKRQIWTWETSVTTSETHHLIIYLNQPFNFGAEVKYVSRFKKNSVTSVQFWCWTKGCLDYTWVSMKW